MKKTSLSSILLLLLTSSTNTGTSETACQAQQIDEAINADISDMVFDEEFPMKQRRLEGDDEKPAENSSDSSADSGGEAKPDAAAKQSLPPSPPPPPPSNTPPEDAQEMDSEVKTEEEQKAEAEKKAKENQSQHKQGASGGVTRASMGQPGNSTEPVAKKAKKKMNYNGQEENEEEEGEKKEEPKKVEEKKPSESDNSDEDGEKKKKTNFVETQKPQKEEGEVDNDEEEDTGENEVVPQKSEEQVAAETAKNNVDIQKDFDTKVETSADFKDEYFKGYTSKRGKEFVAKLKKRGAIIELLEPRARQWISVPQSKNPMKRKNCKANADTKSHFLATTGSKNYIQWRVKRISKEGNCTIKMSSDGGHIFNPITPVGQKVSWFACGRKTGYENILVKLPKNMVTKDPSSDYVILQFEMYTSFGPIVQCADLIIQKSNANFANQKCDPHCKNGGVCKQGKCQCGQMFYGDSCEFKSAASGAYSMLLIIFVVAMIIAGVALLFAGKKLENQRAQMPNQQQNQNRGGQGGPPM